LVRSVLNTTLVLVVQIKPDQWIQLNGRWVLNDFNLAKILTWNPVEQENCNVASGYSGNRFQAPEQLNEDSPRSEKLDVFALGNMLGFLLTQDGPFPDLSGDSVEEEVAKGRIWKITDPKILKSKHPFDVNVRKAMEMCLVVDPKKRPSAQTVADMLRKALSKYKKSKLSQ
jgi:serine/threonine protein kinase